MAAILLLFIPTPSELILNGERQFWPLRRFLTTDIPYNPPVQRERLFLLAASGSREPSMCVRSCGRPPTSLKLHAKDRLRRELVKAAGVELGERLRILVGKPGWTVTPTAPRRAPCAPGCRVRGHLPGHSAHLEQIVEAAVQEGCTPSGCRWCPARTSRPFARWSTACTQPTSR